MRRNRSIMAPCVALPLVRRRLMVLILACLLAIVPLKLVLFNRRYEHSPLRPIRPAKEEIYTNDSIGSISAGDRRFALIIPVDSPSPELCKLVVSAIALGYPSPIIVNWGKDFAKTQNDYGGSHLAKVSGTLHYLDAISQPSTYEGERLGDDDLVLVVDAYDIWFQLPPTLLLDRYHKANVAANERLCKQWARGEGYPFKQTIVVSSQRRCFPHIEDGFDQHCDILPESTLPPHIYGPYTDSNSERYHDVRPRFLNSGSIMGPVSDMRRYFRRVKERIDRKVANGLALKSDQGVFGEILGEQEVWRNWRRQLDAVALRQGLVQQNRDGAGLVQQDFEFHVGLDYTQDLFLPTIYGDQDGEFVALGNQSVIDKSSRDRGISPVRLKGIPYDIEQTEDPLKPMASLPGVEQVGWGEIPLYADFFTASVPVVLHHNAWRKGLKQRRHTWWTRTWYFPYLRDLLDQQLSPRKLKPLAQFQADGGKLTYYATKTNEVDRKPRLYTSEEAGRGLRTAEFDDLCRYPPESKHLGTAWYEEVFRDDLGPV